MGITRGAFSLGDLLRCLRQPDDEFRTANIFRKFNRATVGVNNRSDNPETETRATVFPTGGEERCEDLLPV